MTGLAHRPEAVLLALLVAVVYPLVGLRRFRRIENLPEPLPSRTLLRIYWSLIVSQWLLVTLTAMLFFGAGRSLADIGQSLGPRPAMTIFVGGALLAAFALLAKFTTGQLRTAQLTDLPHRMRKAGKILPQNGEERAWFIAVALTAGVCEEILYRGFLPWFIDAHTGGFRGVGYVVAAVVFGLGHAYQGKDGMVVTAILGLIFGAIAFSVRSLVPGQLLHVAIDLINGIAVGATLARIRLQPDPVVVPAPDIDAPAAPSA